MKKILLTGFMLLLSAGWVVAQSSDQATSSAQSSNGQTSSSAQSSTSGSSASSQAGDTAAGQTSDTTGNSTTADTSKDTKDNNSNEMRGCITQVNGDFMFTSVSGRRYVLQGDQHLIGNHLGQAVELNGGRWHNTGTTSTTAPTEATDGSASPRSITVKQITPIEGKCTPDYH